MGGVGGGSCCFVGENSVFVPLNTAVFLPPEPSLLLADFTFRALLSNQLRPPQRFTRGLLKGCISHLQATCQIPGLRLLTACACGARRWFVVLRVVLDNGSSSCVWWWKRILPVPLVSNERLVQRTLGVRTVLFGDFIVRWTRRGGG